MRLKLLAVLLFAVACFAATEFWVHGLQPELMADVALKQMERGDEAPRLMRVANQAQQWPFVAAALAIVVGSLLILVPSGQDRQRSRI
jgi:hypothetical protein